MVRSVASTIRPLKINGPADTQDGSALGFFTRLHWGRDAPLRDGRWAAAKKKKEPMSRLCCAEFPRSGWGEWTGEPDTHSIPVVGAVTRRGSFQKERTLHFLLRSQGRASVPLLTTRGRHLCELSRHQCDQKGAGWLRTYNPLFFNGVSRTAQQHIGHETRV